LITGENMRAKQTKQPPMNADARRSNELEPNVPYERFEDMSPLGRLRVIMQEDGDAIVSVIEDPNEHRLCPSVEFCTSFGGGGQSPKVRAAIIALAMAIKEENQTRPQHRR
jgi:hypothetical protein